MISVIMSIYNEPIEWIRLSIDSILNQTYSDFEFIIINDKPNRIENISVLNLYASKDARIVIINNEQNIGLTKSLNKGLEVAKGEYIARMDADDICTLDRFEVQVNFLKSHRDIDVCGSSIICFGKIKQERKFPLDNNHIYLFVENCFAHPTVMGKSECFKNYKYNEDCRYAQDYELWYRMFMAGLKFNNIEEPLLYYRTSSTQIGSTHNTDQNAVGCKIRRATLCKYLADRGVQFNFEADHVKKHDIDIIVKHIDVPFDIYQKLLLYLSLSVECFYDRISLIILLVPRYKMSWNNFVHVIFQYIFRKQVYLF